MQLFGRQFYGIFLNTGLFLSQLILSCTRIDNVRWFKGKEYSCVQVERANVETDLYGHG